MLEDIAVATTCMVYRQLTVTCTTETWLTRQFTDKWMVNQVLTGQFADKPSRGQSSLWLVNTWTWELLHYICTLPL